MEVDNIRLLNINPDTLDFEITLTSKQSTAYHATIKAYCIMQESYQPKYLINNFEDAYLNDVVIPQDKKISYKRPVDGKNAEMNNTVFYFVRGRASRLKS